MFYEAFTDEIEKTARSKKKKGELGMAPAAAYTAGGAGGGYAAGKVALPWMKQQRGVV